MMNIVLSVLAILVVSVISGVIESMPLPPLFLPRDRSRDS